LEERRRPRVGDVVVFHTEKGVARNALVICVFDQFAAEELPDGSYSESKPLYKEDDLTNLPCLNLVFVSDDGDREDSYGRQIERPSSVTHRSQESEEPGPHGYYWRFPWETAVPYVQPSEK
jgi:hypothetical protein